MPTRPLRRPRGSAAASLARVRAVTEALGGVLDSAEAARIVAEACVEATGAAYAVLSRLVDGGAFLEIAHTVNYPAGAVDSWRRVPVDAPGPLRDAIESRAPVLLGSREELLARYPLIGTGQIRSQAWAIVPLLVGDRPLGGISLAFDEPRSFDEEDATLLMTLAAQCAQALDRARLFQEVREREERFRAVVEQSADAIVVVEGLEAVYVNDAYARLVGVASAEEVLGTTGERWTHPDDVALVRERALARQRGEPVPPVYEFRIVREDGEVRAVEVAATPITHGGRSATLAVLRDVTERRRSADAQRLLGEASAVLGSSLDYETTLAAVADLMVPAIADWCTLYLREGDELRRVGHSCADPGRGALLRQLARRYPRRSDRPDPVMRVVETGQSVLAPTVTREGLAQHAYDDEHRQLLLALDPRSAIIVPLVTRGQVLGALGLNRTAGSPPYRADELTLAEELGRRCAVAIDNARLYTHARDEIAARERAEAALRASESRLRRLVEANVIGVMIATTDGAIVEANDAFLRMLGYSRAELEAGALRWDALTPPEWRALDDRGTAQLRERGVAEPWEKEYFHRDGRRVPVMIGPALLEGSDDTSIVFALDLTDLKRAQAELARLYADEQQARGEAEAAVRARDQFLSIAAHELRTPLTAVRGAAQLLTRARDRGALTPEMLDRHAATIVDGARRLARLVDDLLDVARLRTGQLALRLGAVELAALVRAAAERAAEGSARHSILVQAVEACVVTGDPDRLAQVVENLLDNAVKYSPSGGDVTVTLRREGSEVALRVADEGIGLPAGTAETIFAPFNRAPNASAAHLPGMGLGLHVCRGIVALHGGRIWAESEGEGRGATFVVVLPCAEDGSSG